MSDAVKRPRAELLPIAEELLGVLAASCVRIELAGSLRRETPLVGDVELVAIPRIDVVETVDPTDLFSKKTAKRINRLWEELDKLFQVTPGKEQGVYIKKGDRYRAFSWPTGTPGKPVQVDLFTATVDNWGLIYLIRTGSGDFSKHVVTTLRDRDVPSFEGYLRKVPDAGPASYDGDDGSEGAWKYTEKELRAMPIITTPTEEDVFRLAGIPFRAPRQRT